MSVAEYMQVIGAMIGAFASFVTSIDQRILRRLEKNGALTTDTAISLPNQKLIGRWRLQRLMNHNVVVKTSEDLYYLDRQAKSRFKMKRLRIVIPVLIILLTVMAGYYFVQNR